MEESTSKEKVLKKIRDALIEKTEAPFPIIDAETSVFPPLEDPLDVTFAQELLKVSGKFVYCEGEDEFLAVLQSFILEKDWPVLYCYDEKIQRMLKQGGIPFEADFERVSSTLDLQQHLPQGPLRQSLEGSRQLVKGKDLIHQGPHTGARQQAQARASSRRKARRLASR